MATPPHDRARLAGGSEPGSSHQVRADRDNTRLARTIPNSVDRAPVSGEVLTVAEVRESVAATRADLQSASEQAGELYRVVVAHDRTCPWHNARGGGPFAELRFLEPGALR